MEITRATLHSRSLARGLQNKPINSIQGFENQFDRIIAFEEECELMEWDLFNLARQHPKSKKYFKDITINLNTFRSMLVSILQWIDWAHLSRSNQIDESLVDLHSFLQEKKYNNIPTLILNKNLVITYKEWSEEQIRLYDSKQLTNPTKYENYYDLLEDTPYNIQRSYMNFRIHEMRIEALRFMSSFFQKNVKPWIVQNHIEWAAMTQLTKCLEHMILC